MYSALERLRDQRPVTIRAVRPDDKGLVTTALGALSAESIYRRLFTAKPDFVYVSMDCTADENRGAPGDHGRP